MSVAVLVAGIDGRGIDGCRNRDASSLTTMVPATPLNDRGLRDHEVTNGEADLGVREVDGPVPRRDRLQVRLSWCTPVVGYLLVVSSTITVELSTSGQR